MPDDTYGLKDLIAEERQSAQDYKAMADLSDDMLISAIFLAIASDEEKHADLLEAIEIANEDEDEDEPKEKE